MVDVRELKAEMVRNGYTQEKLAKEIGMSTPTFIRRMKSGVFNTDEAQKITDVLKLKNPSRIFFAETVT